MMQVGSMKYMTTQPKISILNITARWGGMDVLRANLERQVFKDFEIVIVDALWCERESQVKRYFKDFNLIYIRQSDKKEGAYTNLAHADNEGFRNCRGELIVCLQDYQWILPAGFSKYWFFYQHDPRALVTGIGHHYSDPRPTNPTGKITVFNKPYTGRPTNLSWSDPRTFGASFREAVAPEEWELSWCSLPRSVIYDLGGMDEEFDNHGFAWDNTYIAYKAKMLGCKIHVDQTNEVMGFDHDLWWPNPLKVNRVSPSEYFHKEMKEFMAGKSLDRKSGV